PGIKPGNTGVNGRPACPPRTQTCEALGYEMRTRRAMSTTRGGLDPQRSCLDAGDRSARTPLPFRPGPGSGAAGGPAILVGTEQVVRIVHGLDPRQPGGQLGAAG